MQLKEWNVITLAERYNEYHTLNIPYIFLYFIHFFLILKL